MVETTDQAMTIEYDDDIRTALKGLFARDKNVTRDELGTHAAKGIARRPPLSPGQTSPIQCRMLS